MNKFILVLLIAVASCVTVEFDGSNLEGFIDWWNDIWNKFKDFIKSIPGYLKSLYDWLEGKGYIKQLVEIVEKYGKPKAVELCKSWIESDYCSDIVDFIFNFLK